MASVMMGGDDKNNPMFHDFLGMTFSSGGAAGGRRGGAGAKDKLVEVEAETSISVASMGTSSGGYGLATGNSDLGSGRKRCNLDSAFMGLTRDGNGIHLGAPNSPGYSHLRKEVLNEWHRRSLDAERIYDMQPMKKQASGSLLLHPPARAKPDPVLSKWELPPSMNPGHLVRQNSRLSQSNAFMDKVSPYTYGDSKAEAVVISQTAADEGSRTGIKGTGVLNVINYNGSAVDRNSTGMFPSNGKHGMRSCFNEPESSEMPSHRGTVASGRQMTIFYDGQAHVFDDVHQDKADIIMALARSNGGSWSTTYAKSMSSGAKPLQKEDETAGLASASFSHTIQANLEVPRLPVSGDVLNFMAGNPRGSRSGTDVRPSIQTEHDSRGERKL